MKILVVGATGVLGRAVGRRLREQGCAVRAITRTPARAGEPAALGAEVMAGDLVDPATLASAFAGMDRVLAAAPRTAGWGVDATPRSMSTLQGIAP